MNRSLGKILTTLLIVLLSIVFTSCKDLNNKLSTQGKESSGLKSIAASGDISNGSKSFVKYCLSKLNLPEVTLLRAIPESSDMEILPSYSQFYLPGNLLFPQTDFALKVFSARALIQDSSIDFSKPALSRHELQASPELVELVAKAMTNAHKSNGVKWASTEFITDEMKSSGVKEVPSLRVQYLVRGFFHLGNILILESIAEDRKTVAAFFENDANRDQFCSILDSLQTLVETFKSPTVKRLNREYFEDLKSGNRDRVYSIQRDVAAILIAESIAKRPEISETLKKIVGLIW
jgi:hypothetical protein